MRIGMVMDYGHLSNATSLNHTVMKLFREMGKIMNEKKNFTIAITTINNCGIGDINQHYDIISVPNWGGYKFPFDSLLSSKNLILELVGIDEVVLGRESFRTNAQWEHNKPIIEQEVEKWKKYNHKIKMIHVVTEPEKDQMMKFLNIPEEKISIIPLGVDHTVFEPAKDKLGSRKQILSKFHLDDKPYFIHDSEINWARKNIPRMLKAYEKSRKMGIKQNLIIVGKQDDNYVKKKSKRIDGVICLGHVKFDELVQLTQCADALIFPSLHEGFGHPIVEAMSCGIPIITSKTFSPPWVVKDGGLFVDPYDVDDISKKIYEIGTNKKLCKSLAEKAYNRSLFFSWSKMAKQVLALFQSNYNSTNFDFQKNYEISAYRTLTTLVETIPKLRRQFTFDIVKFDYSNVILWARTFGMSHPDTADFLHPFKKWLNSK